MYSRRACCWFCVFFNDTATTEIYTLSLHDALPILRSRDSKCAWIARPEPGRALGKIWALYPPPSSPTPSDPRARMGLGEDLGAISANRFPKPLVPVRWRG